jgi:hypothetical protein
LIGRAVVAGYTENSPMVQFAKLEGSDFVSRCGALLGFALLTERTVEGFLTICRVEEANKKARLPQVYRDFFGKASGAVK